MWPPLSIGLRLPQGRLCPRVSYGANKLHWRMPRSDERQRKLRRLWEHLRLLDELRRGSLHLRHDSVQHRIQWQRERWSQRLDVPSNLYL